MSLEIDPEEGNKRIDEFLEQIEELLDKNYNEGKEEKRSMSTKLDNFAEFAFSDGKDKKNDLHRPVGGVWGRKNPRQKQRDYEKSLKHKKDIWNHGKI